MDRSYQSGSGMMLLLIILATVSLIVLSAAGIRMQNLAKMEVSKASQQELKQLQNYLDVVFSNPNVCSNVLRLAGPDFYFDGMLTPGTKLGSDASTTVTVTDLKITSVIALTMGYYKARFTAHVTAADGKTVRAPSALVVYHPVSNTVDDCRLEVDPRYSCENLGLVWNLADSRCEICEKLSGTWATGVCTL